MEQGKSTTDLVRTVDATVARLIKARESAPESRILPIDLGAAAAARRSAQALSLRLRDAEGGPLPTPSVKGTVPGGIQFIWDVAAVKLTIEFQPRNGIAVELRRGDKPNTWIGAEVEVALRIITPLLRTLLQTAKFQRALTPIIRGILCDGDLQGAVALELEPTPYIKEAEWLSSRLTGRESGASAVLPVLLEAFGEPREALQTMTSMRSFEFWSIAERLMSEVVTPLFLLLRQCDQAQRDPSVKAGYPGAP